MVLIAIFLYLQEAHREHFFIMQGAENTSTAAY